MDIKEKIVDIFSREQDDDEDLFSVLISVVIGVNLVPVILDQLKEHKDVYLSGEWQANK